MLHYRYDVGRIVLGFVLITQAFLLQPRLVQAFAQVPACQAATLACYEDQIRVSPPTPTEHEAIQITVSGTWCAACVPEYQSHQRVANTIRIDAYSSYFEPGVVCAAVLTPWAFRVALEPLPIGVYTVEVYMNGGLYKSSTFLVPAVRVYLPLIRPK